MIEYTLPVKLESTANLREHWAAKHRRMQRHRNAAIVIRRHSLPCVVELIRVAPRRLDGDNLQNAFKGLRDGVADRLGVDDADPRVEWRYGQERGEPKQYAVKVRIRDAQPA